MFFIPSGALHYIANVGKEKAEILLQFSHENPEDFSLSSSVGMFSNAVLGNTWGVNAEHFIQLKRPLKDQFAVITKNSEKIPIEAHITSPYHYNLEASAPILNKSGGSARMARQNMWAILKQQALYSLRLANDGMREPHWHPKTSEMGYVNAGQGRMSILNPKCQVDTYLLQPGDLYFIPKAYPHHIENIGNDLLHFLIFFDQSIPEDIGFTGSIRSFPDEILSAILKVDTSFIQGLNKYYADLFIVDKINPTDPLEESFSVL
jgi:oxalate decarboxylase